MRQASQSPLKLTVNSSSRPDCLATWMRDLERLNLLSMRNEQRSMQVMQPAHFEGSAIIERPSRVTFVCMCADYSRRPAGHKPIVCPRRPYLPGIKS
jgi:hypothetical protein